MQWIGVPAAAQALGMSAERVRRLIRSGRLPAHRVGGRWLVDRASVAHHAATQRRPGRPFGPRHAWALLALASGRSPEWVPRSGQERLARALHAKGVGGLVGQLRHRADVQRWYVHPALVDEVLAEDAVVVSGARASVPLRYDRGPAAVYVPVRSVDELRSRYRPEVDGDNHNLVVRVVNGPWPFEAGERVAWPAVAAVDLLEDHPDDARCRRTAEQMLADIDA